LKIFQLEMGILSGGTSPVVSRRVEKPVRRAIHRDIRQNCM